MNTECHAGQGQKCGTKDHWDDLASVLRDFMAQVTDARLLDLEQKLRDDGWDKPRTYPLSTSRADEHLRYFVMQWVKIEISERKRK